MSTLGGTRTGVRTRTGIRTGRRIIPRTPEIPGFGQDDDDDPVFGVDAEDDVFDTGILSGDEAFEQIDVGFESTRANAPGDIDRALDDVFPGETDFASGDGDPWQFGR